MIDLNPFDNIKDQIDKLGDRIRQRVKVELMEEAAATILSRLVSLNPERSGSYQAAIREIEKD